jgi:Cdc6-like AAA superfamily ATPase
MYLTKSLCIQNPCAWSKSHPFIADWLSTATIPKLFISGKPGTGKSVLAAHMIDIARKQKEDTGHRGVLLYYFCGADPAADQYSDIRQETSSKAILMTLLRQIVSACHHNTAGLSEVMKYVLASGHGMLSELELRRQVANLLKSFDTVRCAECLPY